MKYTIWFGISGSAKGLQHSVLPVVFACSFQINSPSLLKCVQTFFRICTTKWIEDYDVAVCARTLWENTVKLIKQWLSLPVNKRPKDNKSNEILVKHHLDVTVTVKLHFFKFIASLFQEVLVSFQSDKPLIPFLSNSLENIIKTIMKMFVLPDVIQRANTPYKLIKLDLTKANTCLPPELIKLVQQPMKI